MQTCPNFKEYLFSTGSREQQYCHLTNIQMFWLDDILLFQLNKLLPDDPERHALMKMIRILMDLKKWFKK